MIKLFNSFIYFNNIDIERILLIKSLFYMVLKQLGQCK